MFPFFPTPGPTPTFQTVALPSFDACPPPPLPAALRHFVGPVATAALSSTPLNRHAFNPTLAARPNLGTAEPPLFPPTPNTFAQPGHAPPVTSTEMARASDAYLLIQLLGAGDGVAGPQWGTQAAAASAEGAQGFLSERFGQLAARCKAIGDSDVMLEGLFG